MNYKFEKRIIKKIKNSVKENEDDPMRKANYPPWVEDNPPWVKDDP